MGSHRPSRQWLIHPFLAADAHRSFCHPFSEPIALCKSAAQTDIEKQQDIEKWLQGTINRTGSGVVRCQNSSQWPNQLTQYLPSHLSSQARLRCLRKQSRRVQRPLPNLSKNSSNPFLVIRPHDQQSLVHHQQIPHPIMKPMATIQSLLLTMGVLTAAVNQRLN